MFPESNPVFLGPEDYFVAPWALLFSLSKLPDDGELAPLGVVNADLN